nr:MAG TPA: putative transcriptional regulator [Caudoviricetes sp.]
MTRGKGRDPVRFRAVHETTRFQPKKKRQSPLARELSERNTQEKGYAMGTAVSNALPGLVTVRQLAEHTGYSRSTVYKWSSGERPSPYPEPVRKNGRVIGWRREDVEDADKRNRCSRAEYLYGGQR